MLSVFITPWQKPTACHCAISRAVRSATSSSSAAAGCGVALQRGEVALDRRVEQAAQCGEVAGGVGEVLEVAEAQEARRHARDHRRGLDRLAPHRQRRADDGQRPRGRDAERVHRLGAEELADRRAQHRAAVAHARVRRQAAALELHLHRPGRACRSRPASARGRRPAGRPRRRTGGPNRPRRAAARRGAMRAPDSTASASSLASQSASPSDRRQRFAARHPVRRRHRLRRQVGAEGLAEALQEGRVRARQARGRGRAVRGRSRGRIVGAASRVLLRVGESRFDSLGARPPILPANHTTETTDARPDARPAPVDLEPDRVRRTPPPRRADRVAPRRGRHPPLHLPRRGGTGAPGGQRARPPGPGLQRPRGHAGLERLPPPRAVFRHLRQRPRRAHAQPAPGARPGGLDRQPCRRPRAVLRHDLLADRQGGLAPVHDRQALDRAVRCRRAAGRQRHRRPAELRGLDRPRERHLRLAGVRRAAAPRRSATPAAPPATRKARCTATARPCCTPRAWRCPIR